MKTRGKHDSGVRGCLGQRLRGVGFGLAMSIGMATPAIASDIQALPPPTILERTEEPAGETEGNAAVEGDRPWLQDVPFGTDPVPLIPRPQPILQLRHGPYFPALEVLAPPPPEPLWPTIVQPIKLVIRLSERRVYVYQGDVIQTSYPIAVGRDGWETPTGTYKVMEMQENPAWKNPFTGAVIPAGHNNPLGDRWIGFWSDGNNVIGFHGTPNENSVGRAASHGCIRMFNRDVRALYAIAEVGMPVIVEP